MKVTKLSAVVAVALFSTHAMAHTFTESGKSLLSTLTKPAVSAEIGTLGYGASVAWAANDTAEVVVGWNGAMNSASYAYDTAKLAKIPAVGSMLPATLRNSEGTKGTATFKLKGNNPYVGINYRPFAGVTTIGAGVIFQKGNGIEATFSGDVTAVEVKQGSDTIKADVKDYTGKVTATNKRDLAPYLTIGLKPPVDSRFGIFAEVGAAYTGQVTTDMSFNSGTITNIFVNGNKLPESAPQYSTIQTRAKAQLEGRTYAYEDKVNANLNKFPIAPIVKVGATFRF